jgi:peptidyl-prolyl cis-trans isomerase B (cyclophilin B)
MHRVLVLALLVATAGCGGDDSGGEEEAAPPRNGCTEVEQPSPREVGTLNAPEQPLAEGKTYRLTFRTSCGDFTVEVDQAASPKTAASFVALAEQGFYDDTTFHRVVPGFVIQGGDPTGSGAGGPGYKTVDTPAADTKYTKGVVAMAKTAAEAPGTAGSQFFVVTAEDAGLPPDYAVVGRVTEGMDTVEKIEALGDETTEQPSQPVVVTGVDVESE